MTLYKLIGMIDDKNPKAFNIALARKGYKIQFICRDGYKPTIPSRWIIKKKNWIIAKLKNGKLLANDEGPFRFVGGSPITQPFNNKLAARMVVRIKLIF
jgi:predicted metal-dependent hydrolase